MTTFCRRAGSFSTPRVEQGDSNEVGASFNPLEESLLNRAEGKKVELQEWRCEFQFVRGRCRLLLEKQDSCCLAKAISVFLGLLVVASACAICLESMAEFNPAVHKEMHALWSWFEKVIVIVFSIEYCLRLWATDSNKLTHITTPSIVIDLVSICHSDDRGLWRSSSIN